MQQDSPQPDDPSDTRTALQVGVSVAERFMRISPPRQTYMYGVGLFGILELWEATGERRFLDFYLARRGDKPRFDWWLYRLTSDKRWLEGAREQGERFLADSRRDREGALLDPRGRYTVDVFSHQFTFPVILGHVLGDPRYFDEAARLFEVNRGYLEDPGTGLWYSRWGHSLHTNRPNPGLWGRGNGWLASAWARVMHLWDPAHSAYAEILDAWQRFCASIAAFQTRSGLFRQLLNRPDCFEETSASGLFCSAFANGVRFGTLPDASGAAAWRAFCGIREVVDADGNIYNTSTFAGGYNFERQYTTCARFNDPHGDGTVMSACAALHLLLKGKPGLDRQEPAEAPRRVTSAVAGLLTADPPPRRRAAETAPPVLKRALQLADLPVHDPFGATIQGLLHWHEFSGEATALGPARAMFSRCHDRLSPVARWSLAAEIELRTGPKAPDGLRDFVNGELGRMSRDRCGLFLDDAGGYDVTVLYLWLPLLAKTAHLTGEARYFDEACRQYLGYRTWLEDPQTRLWFCAYGHGDHPRRRMPGLWALGNGYALAGAVSLLDFLPRCHARHVDVVCAVRRHVEALHEYLPVFGGWSQVLDNPGTFRCVAATALLTYGCAKAVFRGWVEPEYYAVVTGGIWHLGEMVDEDGAYRFSSLPTGGLDTLAAYEAHRVENDPGSLGFILSACAWGAFCEASGIDYDTKDKRLGAR